MSLNWFLFVTEIHQISTSHICYQARTDCSECIQCPNLGTVLWMCLTLKPVKRCKYNFKLLLGCLFSHLDFIHTLSFWSLQLDFHWLLSYCWYPYNLYSSNALRERSFFVWNLCNRSDHIPTLSWDISPKSLCLYFYGNNFGVPSYCFASCQFVIVMSAEASWLGEAFLPSHFPCFSFEFLQSFQLAIPSESQQFMPLS